MRLKLSCKFSWTTIAILLVAVVWFVDIRISFRSEDDAVRIRGDSSNNRTFTTTIEALNTTVDPPKCSPPLAKLSYYRKRLDEPRIDLGTAEKMKQVACEFLGKSDIEFPQAMQQLYRCFSYFQDYHTIEPFLLLPDAKVENKLRSHPFISGMMEIFEEQMEVETHQKTAFTEEALSRLRKAHTVDIQTFNGIGNFSIRHAYHLHVIVKMQFDLDDTSVATCEHSNPRIAILHGKDKRWRSMLNALANQAEVEDLSRNSIVNIKHFAESDFREQVSFFRSVDVLISPHGAQLTGVAFMNSPCSRVLEMFPKVRFLTSVVVAMEDFFFCSA